MKRTDILFIVLIIGVTACLHLYGITWGVPDRERISRVFQCEENVRALSLLMRNSHEEMEDSFSVYNLSGADKYDSGERIKIPYGKRTVVVARGLLDSLRSYLIRSYGADEQRLFVAFTRLEPSKLNLDPKFYVYGGVYLYPCAVFMKVLSSAGVLRLKPDMAFYFEQPGEMGKLYVAGRVFGALGAILSVVFFYFLCRNLFPGRILSLTLTFLFGICPAIAVWSHYQKPFSYGILWIVLTMLAVVKFRQAGNIRFLVLASACAGLAFGTLLTYGYIFWLVILAVLFTAQSHRAAWKQLAISVAVFGAVYLIANPYVVTNWKEFIREISFLRSYWKNDLSYKDLGFFLGTSLRYGLGAGLWSFIIAGIVASIVVKPEKTSGMFLLAFFPGLLYFGLTTGRWVHYGLLLYPLLFIAAGCGLQKIRFPLVRGLLIVWAGIFTLLYTGAQVRLFGQPNVRDEAGAWINRHIPAGASVGLLEAPSPWRTPPFRYLSYDTVMGYNEKTKPEYVLVSEYQWLRGGNLADVQAMLAGYSIAREWNKPASFAGVTFTHPEKIPYDWCHPNPRIILWKRQ